MAGGGLLYKSALEWTNGRWSYRLTQSLITVKGAVGKLKRWAKGASPLEYFAVLGGDSLPLAALGGPTTNRARRDLDPATMASIMAEVVDRGHSGRIRGRHLFAMQKDACPLSSLSFRTGQVRPHRRGDDRVLDSQQVAGSWFHEQIKGLTPSSLGRPDGCGDEQEDRQGQEAAHINKKHGHSFNV
jgi:hypothetical protein